MRATRIINMLQIEGVIMCLANFTIFLLIVWHDALRNRKEYIILAAQVFCWCFFCFNLIKFQALADGMNGVAYVYSGIVRFMFTYE
jgi:hypothetical protein